MTTAERIPVVQGTDDWLAARREGIGSSDAPVIAGEKGSLVELWGEKTGLAPRPEPDAATAELFAWGHRLEPLVAEAYTEHTDRPVRRVRQLLRHPNVPWALASLDRVSARKGERRIVELKVTSIDAKYADGLPGDVLAQVQHQLWVTGYDVADVAVLQHWHWRLGVFEVERDDAYLEDLTYLERHFWDLVERRELPPVDGSENTRRVLGRLWQQTNGLFIPPAGDTDAMAEELRIARAEAKAAEARVATVENAIRAVIGEADGLSLSSGEAITWRRNADSERTNWESVARALRERLEYAAGTDGAAKAWDEALAWHTTKVDGPRVLRVPRSWTKKEAA